jgi:hypothetical protein
MESISWPLVKDVGLFAIAVYGALLSTFNWREALKKDHRQISVNASTAMPTYHNGHVGVPFAKIEAINTGHRVVIVKTLTFELSTGARMFPTTLGGFPGLDDTQLPATLSDGQSAFMMVSYADIGGALISNGKSEKVKLTPVCVDSADTVYRGEPWEVDPTEFMQM